MICREYLPLMVALRSTVLSCTLKVSFSNGSPTHGLMWSACGGSMPKKLACRAIGGKSSVAARAL